MAEVSTVAECPADDGFLLALMTAMTAELVVAYDLPSDARPRPLDPASRYLLARDGERAIGCCAVEPVGPGVYELKRMFVAPDVRGTEVSNELVAESERVARSGGGVRLRLETGVRQPAAMRLYERAGYRRVPNFPPYEADPESVCYEKVLGQPERRE
ncbi:GNAT family N-acetyltransferase [Amycolatopsis sp. NPDC048633]|uniref:GNAT family N-acetyltransferase n=1 Tax=Amycolatopsis sp. NPDC048633 TaxID=3157095 RepID=UPI0033C9FFBA